LEYKTFTISEDKSNRLRDVFIGAAVGAISKHVFNTFQIKIPISMK